MSGQPPIGFWETAAAWHPAFAIWAAETRRRPRGIWFSELFAFLTCCRLLRVDTVVESGIHGGQSSGAIQCWHQGTHYGIDRLPVECGRSSSMRFLRGDALALVPPLLGTLVGEGQRVALLLDGPKDLAAVALAEEALALGAVFVAVHDLYQPDEPEERAARCALRALCPTWFTDDSRFVLEYQALDGPVDNRQEDPRIEWCDETGRGKLPYWLVFDRTRLTPMRSYGPTLGLAWRETVL